LISVAGSITSAPTTVEFAGRAAAACCPPVVTPDESNNARIAAVKHNARDMTRGLYASIYDGRQGEA
jgi:hypothetical protein